MQLFFAPDLSEKYITLDREESHHAIDVMRLKQGMQIQVTDGKGSMAECIIAEVDSKKCILEVKSFVSDFGRRTYYIHVAIAPTKNIDRMEWFLEKATEIGIDEISPIICQRSERKVINEDRLNKLIVSAAKQSIKAKFPILNKLISFKTFVAEKRESIRYIAHCADGLKETIMSIKPASNVLICIGPEGDFTNEEINFSLANDYKGLTLGDMRLRTETAGVMAVAALAVLNGN